VWTFRGAAHELQTLRQEFIIAGPSETGKTVACLALVDRLAREYPGCQGAIIRKVRADMDGTVLLTFGKKIISGRSDVRPFGGEKAEWYDYSNGSRVWVGGIDKPGKVLSGERDFVYVNQGEELLLSDWETLTTRTTGRAGNAPFGFTFGDCNPRGSQHWIRALAKDGKLKLLNSHHADNPRLYDDSGAITDAGKASLAKLDALSGLRRDRLFLGKWVQAEGAVYESFNQEIHVKERDANDFAYIAMAADDGYTNPAALLWVGIDPDGRLHVLDEWYERGKLHSEIAQAANASRFARPSVLICDTAAAALVAEMAAIGLPAIGHKGPVLEGIDLVHSLLKTAGDGLPRLTISPRCHNLISEIEGYTWKVGSREEPVKENDHALDGLRYLVHYLYAPREDDSVQVIYDPVRIG
jgi:PBSX family phage terminase large subunit